MAFDFGSLFPSKNAPLIGVDLSSSSVKVVELAGSQQGGYRLERYAVEVLPKGAITDGNIDNSPKDANGFGVAATAVFDSTDATCATVTSRR